MQNGVPGSRLRVDFVLQNQGPEPLVRLGHETEFSRRELRDRAQEQRLPNDNACGRGQRRCSVGIGEQHTRFHHRPRGLLRAEYNVNTRFRIPDADPVRFRR